MDSGLFNQRIRQIVTETENEASLEQKLRQVAMEIFNTSSGKNSSIRPRITILQEMNKAILAAYIEKHSNPPPATEIQRMRQLVLNILDDIDRMDKMHDGSPQ
jgi:hypothetical protein